MRPHSLGAARGRPARPELRRLLSTLLATALALLGLVALSTSTAPTAHAADPKPISNLLKPSIYNDPPKVGELALAHPGTWYPTPDSVTLEWFRSGSASPIGTGNAILVPFEARGQALTVKATAKKAGYVDTVVSSAASKPVADGTPVNYAKPAIFGTPEVGSTLAVWEGAWSVEADSYAYRWFQAGTTAPIATTPQVVVPAGAAGKELTVEVTLKAAGWNDGVATSDPVTAHAPGTSPVANVVKPTISDDPTVGALAVAHPGVWDPQADAVDVEWFRSGSASPIGTGLTIVVPAAALGETLTVKATAHKAGRDDATATSVPSDPVGKGTLQNAEAPAIFGSPVVGGTVEAWPGAWFPAPDGYTYRWFVAGTVAPVGTGRTLVIPAAAAGKELTVEVTAAKTAYDAASATSDAVTVTADGPPPVQSVAAPSIGGTLKVGETVTANPGTWNPADATKTVAWYRSGSATPLHTGPSLVVPAAAEGEMLSIVVKATKPGNADGYAVSAPQGPVLAAGATPTVQNLVAPAITDAPKVGQLVGAHPGVWNPTPDDVTLEWFRSGSASPIGTGSHIVVPPAAAGQTLTVKATATKGGHTAGEATSEPSDTVAEGTLEAASEPAIYGTPMPGATVVAYEGVWPAGPEGFSYRWFVEGTATPVGTGKELVVPAGTAGKDLTVEVTATKAGYADATLTSDPVTVEEAGSTAIENVAAPQVVVDPAVGHPRVGDLVGVKVGAWNPWPDDYEVTWFRSGSATPIGTDNVIAVPPAALGETLTVKVTATKAGYADGTATSAPTAAVTPGALTVLPGSEPAIVGSPTVGATVEAFAGIWPAGPDGYAYRWFVEGTVAPVGTGKTLVVPAGTAGKDLTVEVTAKKVGYADQAVTSDPVTIVAPGTDPVQNLAAPAITDDPQVGQPVGVHPGVWNPAPDAVTLDWYRSGSPDPIGHGTVIIVPAEAAGQTLTVKATATRAGYAAGTKTSAPSDVVAPGALLNGLQPAIFGAPVVGATVEAWPGSWAPQPDTFTYRWFQAGTAQPIGTGKQLVIPAGAVGKALTVEVTATKVGYADKVVTSGSVTPSQGAACTAATSAVTTATAAQTQAAATATAAQAKVAKLKAKKKAAAQAGNKAKVAKLKARLKKAKAARAAADAALAGATAGVASAQAGATQHCS